MNSNITNNIEHQCQEIKPTCAIYVADLADYNAGILRGLWIAIYGDSTVDEIEDQIQAMLSLKGHEEWEIHDYENLPENAQDLDIEGIIKIAGLIETHGYELTVAFLEHFDVDDIDRFDDYFIGVYQDLEGYAYEEVNACVDLEKALGSLAYYFNYEAYARDLVMGGELYSADIGPREVALFRCY